MTLPIGGTERIYGTCLWCVAILSVVIGVTINPLILEGVAFRPGETLDSLRWRVGLWFVSLVFVAAATLLGYCALRLSSGKTSVNTRLLLFKGLSIVISTSVALALGELYCRVALDLTSVLPVESNLWWEYRWRQSHASETNEWRQTKLTSLNPVYSLDVYHPLLGWTSRPGAREEGVTINASGFRDTREHSFVKPRTISRVVVIGDSFTFGEGVRDDETYPAALERLLPNTHVLNFGVHGYGLDQQYLRLKSHALRYAPDVVLLGFYSDVTRNLLTFRDYGKPRFVMRDGELELTNVPVPPPTELFSNPIAANRLPTSYLAVMVSGHLRRVWNKTRYSSAERFDMVRHLLDAILAESRGVGARLLLVIIPPGFGTGASTEAVCLRWARANGVPVVNVADLFRRLNGNERRKVYHARGDGHYSPYGYQLIAGEIDRVVREEKMLPQVLSANLRK